MKITFIPYYYLVLRIIFVISFLYVVINFSGLNVEIMSFCRLHLLEFGYLCTSNLLISRL